MKIDKIMKCVLELSKADIKILGFFTNHPKEEYDTYQVANKLKFNLSTVQRSVKKLFERNLILRKQENLDNGGYYFYYVINDKNWKKKFQDKAELINNMFVI